MSSTLTGNEQMQETQDDMEQSKPEDETGWSTWEVQTWLLSNGTLHLKSMLRYLFSCSPAGCSI